MLFSQNILGKELPEGYHIAFTEQEGIPKWNILSSNYILPENKVLARSNTKMGKVYLLIPTLDGKLYPIELFTPVVTQSKANLIPYKALDLPCK